MNSEENVKYDLVRSFPNELQKDVRHVLHIIAQDSNFLNISNRVELKVSGEILYIPYRIYYDEPNTSQLSSLTVQQQTILYTLYTRHNNGFVRERNVKKVIAMATDCPWISTYLMLLIGEYVEEVIQVIYENRSRLTADFIKSFVGENPNSFRKIQSRVASYWNCYYRRKYPKPEQYVGFQVLELLKRLLN